MIRSSGCGGVAAYKSSTRLLHFARDTHGMMYLPPCPPPTDSDRCARARPRARGPASGRSRRRRRGKDRALRRRPPRCFPAGSDRAAHARSRFERARNTSKASPTGGAENCSQWIWLSGQPQRRAVSATWLIMPAGPQTYTCVPSGWFDEQPVEVDRMTFAVVVHVDAVALACTQARAGMPRAPGERTQ